MMRRPFAPCLLLPLLLAPALALASPTGGGWTSFSDGLGIPEALDLIDIFSDSEVLDPARDADEFLRDWEALDDEEAACGSAYTDSSGPTVPSHCAEGESCSACYTEAVTAINFNRYYIERARCITAANIKMANSAMAFGDSSSGVHGVTGLSWSLGGKPQIEEAVRDLKKTYTDKAAIYLRNLEGSLKKLGRCEAENYGETDWYQRYGWIYHNFMKAKYQSAPE